MSKKKARAAEREARDKIRELTDENLRLQREIAFLKNELQREKRPVRQLLKKRNKIESTFLRQSKNGITFSQERYFSYVKNLVTNASVFWVYSGIIDAFRRFTFISITFKVIAFIFSLIRSSAVFILSTSAVIVTLPFVFLFSGIGFMLTFLGGRNATKKARPLVKGKHVTVFFPASKTAFRSNSYFAGMVKETAKQPASLCIIVTPGLFFSRGIGEKKRYYFTTRRESENIIIVRKLFYYRFKKKILNKDALGITEIY